MPPSQFAFTGPRVRITICASTVPGADFDTKRWYRFVVDSTVDDSDTTLRASLTTMDSSGRKSTRVGASGFKQFNSGEGVQSDPSAELAFLATPLIDTLNPLLFPMDAVTIEINSFALGGWWTVFDGFICSIDGNISSYADSIERGLRLSCRSIQRSLEAAIYNWQGMIHPVGSELPESGSGSPGDIQRLAEVLEGSVQRPEAVIKAFLSAGVRTAMTLNVGSINNDGGLPIGGYVQFADGTDFRSAFNVAVPIPYANLQLWHSVSFWNLALSMSEPQLHEFFWSYRANLNGPGKIPTLVFRPRPFPGLPEKDTEWTQLPRYEVGPGALPSPFMVREVLSDSDRSNCFTWAFQNMGDASSAQFASMVMVGWFFSPMMVNRFGYSSTEIRTSMAPIFPTGDQDTMKDLANFAVQATEHVARQDMPLPFLKRRSLTFQTVPVRPGCILVDKTAGSKMADWITGYISEVKTVLSASSSSISMSQTVEVIRCLKGCDADGYPAAVRALVPDIQHRTYGSEVLGTSQGPPPAGGAVNTSSTKDGTGPARAAVSAKADPKLADYAKAAADRNSVPPWLVMHILHQETGLGTNFGNPPTALSLRNGIGQITSTASSQLKLNGYTNADGTLYQDSDRSDTQKCVGAVAAYLNWTQNQLKAAGLPPDNASYWSWVARGYRWGVGDTVNLGNATGWTFTGPTAAIGGAPDFANPAPDYARYWSPPGVAGGQALYGSI